MAQLARLRYFKQSWIWTQVWQNMLGECILIFSIVIFRFKKAPLFSTLFSSNSSTISMFSLSMAMRRAVLPRGSTHPILMTLPLLSSILSRKNLVLSETKFFTITFLWTPHPPSPQQGETSYLEMREDLNWGILEAAHTAHFAQKNSWNLSEIRLSLHAEIIKA